MNEIQFLKHCDRVDKRLEILEAACMGAWLALVHADDEPQTIFDEPQPTKKDAQAGLELLADYVAAKRKGDAKAAAVCADKAKGMVYDCGRVSPACGFALAGISNIDDALRALEMCEVATEMVAKVRGEDSHHARAQAHAALDAIAANVLEVRR